MSKCGIEDLRLLGEAVTSWVVDENGEPVYQDEVHDSEFEDEYFCNGCTDYFKGFDKAKAHLEEEK